MGSENGGGKEGKENQHQARKGGFYDCLKLTWLITLPTPCEMVVVKTSPSFSMRRGFSCRPTPAGVLLMIEAEKAVQEGQRMNSRPTL